MKTIALDINDTIRDNISQFINVYQKFIDNSFEIKYDDVTDFDFYNVFPFANRDEYLKFKYEDCAFELFGRAEATSKFLPYKLNDWIMNQLKDFDEEVIPQIIYVSPFEMNLSIQATLSFLSKICARNREYYFPIDSQTIWDRCDILITANPNLIMSVPEGKVVLAITQPYNKDIDTEYRFDNLSSLIDDKDEIIRKLIENEEDI